MRNPQLFGRIFNTPLMIHPAKLDAIIAGIGDRFGIQDYTVNKDMAMIATGEKKRPGYQVIGGIAVIGVFGVLAHRGHLEGDSSFVQGYDNIGKSINAAIVDPDVHGILLEMSSPGGEVAGAFELADQIKTWATLKPIYSAISNLSASANYLLASATNKISITQTGIAGSVGVVMRHADVSKMAEKEGIRIEHIFAGLHKVDGNQFEPLSDAVRARFQTEVDSLYTLFVNTISQYRGLSVDVIRAQEAGVFTGQSAIDAGLADVIATADSMLIEMQQNFSKTTQDLTMSIENNGTDAAANEHALSASRDEGYVAGVSAERTRISAILNRDEAKGRDAQAKAFAFETDMDAETVGKLLAAAPAAAQDTTAGGNEFKKHMDAMGNPKVGADGEDNQAGSDDGKAGWDKAATKLVAMNGGKRS